MNYFLSGIYMKVTFQNDLADQKFTFRMTVFVSWTFPSIVISESKNQAEEMKRDLNEEGWASLHRQLLQNLQQRSRERKALCAA